MSALRYNYQGLRKTLSPETKVMAIVKANAYGHGDIEVSRTLEKEGSDFFGVAIAEEGIRLRQAGIEKPVVVLGGIYPGQIKEVFEHRLTPVVFDIDIACLLDKEASETGVVKNIHVKIDTGMGRLGILPGDVESFFRKLKGFKNLKVEGIMSHFAEAEAEDWGFSRSQLNAFRECVERVKRLGITPDYIDMANSAAAVLCGESRLNLIRPGIMLYGSLPAGHLREKSSVKPVMQLKTKILNIKELGPGCPVSYGRRFITKRHSSIAIIPIGYADGLPRRLSDSGEVIVRGLRARIAGTVCMDLTMVDVTDVPGASVGDDVFIIGGIGKARITAEEVADRAGTISYEILCGISRRVPRTYIET